MVFGRIAYRGVLGVALAVGVLAGIHLLGSWLVQESALDAVRQKGTMASIRAWASALSDPVESRDWNKIDHLIACAVKDESIHRIQICNQFGHSISRQVGEKPDNAKSRRQFAPAALDFVEATPRRGHTIVQYPIFPSSTDMSIAMPDGRTPEALAFVFAEVNGSNGDPDIRTARMRFALLGVVLVAGAAYLLWWLSTRHFGMIGQLTSLAGSLADGSKNAPESLKESTTWLPLVSSIRRLGRAVRDREEQLAQMDRELEERVAKRTRDLQIIAMRDPLTGLYNRRYLNEVLHQRVAEWRRYDAEVSILMIDLDNLKSLNDEYGHQIGDEAIMILASVIGCQLRSPDVAARYGGDEFVVVLPHTDGRQAKAIGERICEQYRIACQEQLAHTQGSLSIGVATVEDDPHVRFEDLLRAADAALYVAKSGGKNRVVTWAGERNTTKS